ncbi:MAG: hypothetical protein HY078_16005 [Elusimicrobia bacterium]|nr:hypothetical protein [Elusimicrobiota bacterium]
MKYWVYLNGEVPGSYEPRELVAVSGFTATSMVCPVSDGVAQRNWQRAGVFPDIMAALRGETPSGTNGAHAAVPPRPPVAPLSPADVVNSTSEKLFRHVTELMRELENRREERSLTQSLERALEDTRRELQTARERARMLENRVSLIPGLEDRERKLEEFLARAKQELLDKSSEATKLLKDADDLRRQAQEATLASGRLAADRDRLQAMVDQLSGQLSERELVLAKALALLQRLESEMGRILPDATAGISKEVPRPYDERAPLAAAAIIAPPLPEVPAPPPPEPPAPPPEPEFVAETPHSDVALPQINPLPDIPDLQSRATAPPTAAPPITAVPPPADAAALAPAMPEPPAEPAPIHIEPAFTRDEGRPESPMELPPEGEVQPVAPPWVSTLKGILATLWPPAPSSKKKAALPKRP